MPAPEPVRPAYDGAWIGAVLPALQAASPPEWLPEAAAVARRVVVLVLDGLGWEMLRANAADLPTLAGMDGRSITCAVPSTTATGLPCLTTGLTPLEHGLLGYRVAVDEGVLNILAWRLDNGRPGPDAAGFRTAPPFGGRALPAVVRQEFVGSGFTTAHLEGGDLRGYQTIAVLREQVRAALATDARVIYAYYDGVDKVAHPHGLNGPLFTAELRDTDRLVAELLAIVPADGALVVTADHGHVADGPDQVVEVGVPGRPLGARAGKAAELERAAREVHGDVAWVFTREELVDGGWLGPAGPAQHARRIGDIVLAPFADMGFADPATPRENRMASRHGSLTPAEMLVPLLAAPGRA